MPSPVMQAALDEVAASLALREPQLEGWRDYDRVDLTVSAHLVAQGEIVRYERRVAKLRALQRAIDDVNEDGHPDMAPVAVSAPDFADLADQKRTIDAAFGQIVVQGEAVSAAVTMGSEQPIP